MSTLKALLILLTLTLVVTLPATSLACETDAERGLICPDDLPDFSAVRTVCADGCFLVTPSFERAARINAKRVKLIEPLRIQLLKLGDVILQQEDQKLQALDRIDQLEAALLDLERREAGDGLGAFAWGSGVGVIVGVVVAAVVWAL